MASKGHPQSQLATDPGDGRQPWERQPGESDRAWAAFQAYRDMGAGNRSFNKTYQKRYSKPSHAEAPQFFRNWAREHRWFERATAWDRHLDDVNRQAQEDEARKWRERRRNLLAVYFAKLAEAVDVIRLVETEFSARLRNPNQPRLKEDVQFRYLTQAVNMIANQLREEFDDLPTQRVEQMAMIVGDSLDHWATMSDDELDQVIDNLQAIAGFQASPVDWPDEAEGSQPGSDEEVGAGDQAETTGGEG